MSHACTIAVLALALSLAALDARAQSPDADGALFDRALHDTSTHERLVTAAQAMGIERYLDRPDRSPLESAICLWSRAARPL